MDYRDERDALRGRVENLEQELGEAKQELHARHTDDEAARIAQLEQQLADAQGLLQDLGRDLSALKGSPPRRRSRAAVIAISATVTVCAVAVGLLLMRRPAPPPLVYVSIPAPRPVEPAQAIEPPKPVEPQQTAAPEPRVAAPRFAKARWRASVRRADGIVLAPGTPCLIEATVEATGTNARVSDLELTCGGRTLYRKSDSFDGMAKLDNDARERLGRHDDQSTFTLQYNDIGTRTGARSQVDLDSTKRDGVVFRETSPRWRVEFTIPVESQPTAPLSGVSQRLRREGHVTKVSGAATVSLGATCVLRAMPTGDRDACVAEVRCGAALLFPASAGVRCTYDGARPIGIASTGEAQTLRLEGQTLEVQTGGAKTSRTVVSLELE